eukprot:gnl/TRDRNA2_/TRDRNA2_47594_c0_seq1.p1 gnl/TRDRNA2_/TRDRNA2_47594_c0~~gnl/TRDRNA2_/TRDRNA2_47594_c0_seq1.p1  ORF type:complete len:218 (-),score=54.48 gnl/TRDRNA2_/TRDRNA2_47594_c0_seq1:99-701(-)
MADGVGRRDSSTARRHVSLSLDVAGPPAEADRTLRKPGRARSMSTLEAFTPEQIAECKDLFSMFDKNADNTIDRQEFGPMMRTLGLSLTEMELDRWFLRIDKNGDGDIAFEELVDFLQRIARPITLEEELTEAFRFFNPDGTQAITKTGLAKVLAAMGEDISETECGDMIMAATNGEEEIDFATFNRFCKAEAKKQGRAA